jgi:hypothetical protein
MTDTINRIRTFFVKHLRFFLTWGIPACIITSYSFLAFQPDLRASIPDIIGATAIITIILAVTIYASEQEVVTWSPSLIMIVAVVLRLLFLFRPPELSDDLYRYVWDGMQILERHNPYSTAPLNAGALGEYSVHLQKLVNHSDLITIYPPAAQILFALGALFAKNILGIKILLVFLDIITIYILIKLLSVLRLPVWRSVLYAWHPLPVIEIAASGHIDGAGVFFFFVALLLLLKQSVVRFPQKANVFALSFSKKGLLAVSAGIAFSFSILVKLVPLIFLPGLLIFVRSRRIALFLSGFLAGCVALIFPFWPDIRNMFVTLNVYLQNWEFSGLLFRTLRLITSSGHSARLILASVFILSSLFFYGMLWSGKDRSPFLTLYQIILAFLFLTPTMHPWYVLYLACLLPFVPMPEGLALSWSIFLSYRVIIPYFFVGKWIENDYTPALIWLAPAGVYLLTLTVKKIKAHRAVR